MAGFRIRKGGLRHGIEGVAGGWNAPLGLVGKRFHPRGWLQPGKRAPLQPLPSEPPLPWLVSLARGKPGENQSPKLEYKPISGGVRGLRTSCARREREDEYKRNETGRDSEGSCAFEQRV